MKAQQSRRRLSVQLFRESLELRQALGDQIGIGLSLMAMANIAGMSGLAERAARWLGTAEAIFDAAGHVMHPAERAQIDDTAQELRARLGDTPQCHRGPQSAD